MSKKKTFFDLRNFDNYINYEERKKELFKDYQPDYIAQIKDSLNATDAQYNYTKITGKPETIEEYYANNKYLGNKANVIKDIKNNLQDKDRILRREENQPKSGKMYETSEEKLQAFPHGIKKRFFDWTTTEANKIYKQLISNNYLSDWEIAVKEGDQIARETEKRARQREEEEEEYELPSHNSNGNTIYYNSNGNPVASWEEEMAHWNSVTEEGERYKMQEENWDSQNMREEEKRRKEEEKRRKEEEEITKPNKQNTTSVFNTIKRRGNEALRKRVKAKRAAAAATRAASMEKSGSSVAAPPPQSFAAPSSSVADTQELINEWVEQISSKGKTYYFNTRTGKTSWVKPPTIPQELYHIGWRTRYDTDKNKYVFDFKPEEVWNTTKMPENMVRNVEELPVEKELSPELIDKGWSSGLSSTRGYYYYKNDNTKKTTYHAREVKGGKKTRNVKGKGKTMKKNIKVKKSMKKFMKKKKTKRKEKN